jgi:hypothetical protein
MRFTRGSISINRSCPLRQRFNRGLELSVRRLTDAPPVLVRWPRLTTQPVSSVDCPFLISSVTVFSPFLPLVLAGHSKRVGPARQAKGCFLRGSQETSHFGLFLGGTANPEGVAAATKQKPAVPPARRGSPHLAVPAGTKGAIKGK